MTIQRIMPSGKNSSIKWYMLYASKYVTILKWQYFRFAGQVGICSELGMEMEIERRRMHLSKDQRTSLRCWRTRESALLSCVELKMQNQDKYSGNQTKSVNSISVEILRYNKAPLRKKIGPSAQKIVCNSIILPAYLYIPVRYCIEMVQFRTASNL